MDTSCVINNSCSFFAHTPSNLKTYGCAIAFILGVGALTAGAIGVAGFCQVGALRHMMQVDAIVTMAVGGIGGIALIIGSVTCFLKMQKNLRKQEIAKIFSTHINRIYPFTKNGLFFGPKEWHLFNMTVPHDEAPTSPTVDESEEMQFVFYIPHKVTYRGETRTFNLKFLEEVFGPLLEIPDGVDKESPSPGWRVMETVIDEDKNQSLGEAYIPIVLEGVVSNLIIVAMRQKNKNILHLHAGFKRGQNDSTPMYISVSSEDHHTLAVRRVLEPNGNTFYPVTRGSNPRIVSLSA